MGPIGGSIVLRRSVCGVALWLVLGLVLPASGIVVVHNGTADSDPPGTDTVPVRFIKGSGTAFELLGSSKAFLGSFATHTSLHTYAAPAVELVSELVVNATGDSWTGFGIDLIGADFFGAAGTALLAPAIDPVEVGGSFGDATIDLIVGAGSITVAGSSITRDGENGSLSMFFGDPVDPGESMVLSFAIRDVGVPGIPGNGSTEFFMTQSPEVGGVGGAIPEPLSAGLVALASVFAAGFATRRRA